MTGAFIREEARVTPIAGSYDVIVVGGGVAGCAAALAAARHGRKTLLVERMYGLGGLATLGLITIYLPLCDGNGRQVSFGMNDEFLRLSISKGWEDRYPDSWLEGRKDHGSQRFEVGFNANIFSILLEKTLQAAGCQILYGSSVVGVSTEHGLINALLVENIAGRTAWRTGAVVDASGDAVVCRLANVPTAVYAKGNALAAWFYETKEGRNVRHMLGAADVLPAGNGEVPEKLAGRRYTGLDPLEVSQMTMDAHERILSRFLEDGPVSQRHSLSSVPAIPELRMTRRLAGSCMMLEKDAHKPQKDSVGLISDWRKPGPVWEVRFGSLYSPSVPNLAVAGRCVSAEDAMWDVTRVIPPCVTTGQAAGTALALDPVLTRLDPSLLARTLAADGVVIHEEDL